MASLLSLVIGILLLVLCGGSDHFDSIVSFVIILFSIGYIFDLMKTKSKTYGIPLVLAYIVRIAFLYYDVYSDNPFNLPLVGGELASDPYYFFEAAVDFSKGYAINYGGFFSKFFGIVFRVTDVSRLWAEFIVMLFSIATLHVAATILDKMDITPTVRKNSMYIIGLMPNYILLSVIFRRETIITFFLSLSILHFIKWIQGRGKNLSFVLSIIFALCASMFHGGTALIVIAYIFAYLVFDPVTGKFLLKQSRIIGAIFFAAVFAIIFFEYGHIFFGKFENLTSDSEIAITRDAGGSSYARYVGDATTPLRMLIYSIPRYLYYMFSPFPWQWRGLSDIITFIMSSLFYMYVIVSAIMYIKRTEKSDRKRSAVIILLIAAFFIALVFSWGVTNIGTATRHRDKFITLYTVIFALTRLPKEKAENKRNKRLKNGK